MTDAATPFGPAYGFGLYIHWPYCARICPYCDFNVYAAKTRDTDPLFDAILKDIAIQARALSGHPLLNSIFLGGGTPSLMTPQQMQVLIETCQSEFGLAPDCEITLEANPNNISTQSAPNWKSAGVNRLSIGLQSLDDAALTFLGRDHNSDDARRAVAIAGAHFETFSIDMIYARPDQSVSEWEAELAAALALGAPHLSLYELTIAPGTAFFKATERGTLTPLPDETQAQMYELTDVMTKAAGLPAYEISNHAGTAKDRSAHNIIYWRSGDWLGVGPGAHGRLTIAGERRETVTHAKPADYIHAIEKKGRGLAVDASLGTSDTAQELVAMGLRPVEGIEQARIETLLARRLDPETLAHLTSGGWLTHENGMLMLSPAGRLLADRVTLELLS